MNFLIVDDDEATCDGIKRRLSRLAIKDIGKVLCSHSAEEALECSKEVSIDILITDINMYKLSGLDLIEELKRKYPRISCIILTAFKDFDYAHRAIQMNVDDFLLKPCSESTMLATVNRVIKRRKDLGLDKKQTLEHYSGHDPVDWACAYVRANIFNVIDMAVVANTLNLSYTYFSKLFRAKMGMSFSEYALKIKIKEAGELIGSGVRAEEVSKRLGYANVQSFARFFAREYGMTPREYRMNKNKGIC